MIQKIPLLYVGQAILNDQALNYYLEFNAHSQNFKMYVLTPVSYDVATPSQIDLYFSQVNSCRPQTLTNFTLDK